MEVYLAVGWWMSGRGGGGGGGGGKVEVEVEKWGPNGDLGEFKES